MHIYVCVCLYMYMCLCTSVPNMYPSHAMHAQTGHHTSNKPKTLSPKPKSKIFPSTQPASTHKQHLKHYDNQIKSTKHIT